MQDKQPPALRVGLLGHPLGHSLSPAMQDAAFSAAGLPYRYELLDVAASALPALATAMRRGGWLGCNITIPYKTTIVPLLDELRGETTALGAVNTVQVEGNRLVGYNTDVFGFIDHLATYPELRSQAGSAVVLGAGGAARAVTWALAEHGWTVNILARHPEQAQALGESLPGGRSLVPGALDAATTTARLADARLLVNCTPAGMWPDTDADPLPATVPLSPGVFVYDLIYRPIQTALLRRAAAAGCRTTNGLPMLVAQGAAAFTIWTGQDAPRRLMRTAAEQALLASGEAGL